MFSFLKKIASLFRLYNAKDKRLAYAIVQITGRRPLNLQLYKLATRHASAAESDSGKGDNERLEYLGDAILGAIIAEYLFKKFPYKDEGFLTEIRSRIVNRESLNDLARKIGIGELIEFDSKRRGHHSHRSMYGDAMEAFVGAFYLDRGFDECKSFVIERLISHHFDLEQIVHAELNHKSRLIEWAQRESKKIVFEIISENGSSHQKEFKVQILVNGEPTIIGSGFSKKKAEQAAAAKLLEQIKTQIVPPQTEQPNN